MLAATSKVLAGLVIRLRSATLEEIPALVNQAKSSMEQIVKCCNGIASLDHLSPEIVDLISSGETLQAQIAGVVEVREAQLSGPGSRAPARY